MNLVFFDLETQNLLQDVGGRSGIEKLRLSCGVTFSTAKNDFTVYWEQDAQALIDELKAADRVIGFQPGWIRLSRAAPLRSRFQFRISPDPRHAPEHPPDSGLQAKSRCDCRSLAGHKQVR